MTYNNRIRQLCNTLDSYMHFYRDKLNSFEIVIVEDSPEDEEILLKTLEEKFPKISFKYKAVDRSKKKFRNPGVLYNLAAELASNENLLITNPENIHKGDVLSKVEELLQDNTYMVFACKSAFQPPAFKNILDDEDRYIQSNDPFAPRGFYQHSKHNNRLLHFLSAIKKTDYQRIGGFDAIYDDGISVEDNDFVCKIITEKFDVITIDEPYCIHQAHNRQPYNYVKEKYDINLNLFIKKWGGPPHEVLPKMLEKFKK